MAVYAIGDIQGCYTQLRQLLDRLGFDPAADRLWLCGDLVNRGPDSLQTLRFVKGLGASAISVLGNHDLHLLAVWQDEHHHFKDNDTLLPVINAPDREELLHWLRHQPLLHHDPQLGFTMVHAGLPPQWDLATARSCAHEVETALRGERFVPFMQNMYGNKPKLWSESLSGWERLRFAVNCFTRLRFCTPTGELDFHHKGRPEETPAEVLPWFRVPGARWRGERLLFGHWSALGYHHEQGVHALDSGCLWGGALTALRLDHPALPSVQLDCPGARAPKAG